MEKSDKLKTTIIMANTHSHSITGVSSGVSNGVLIHTSLTKVHGGGRCLIWRDLAYFLQCNGNGGSEYNHPYTPPSNSCSNDTHKFVGLAEQNIVNVYDVETNKLVYVITRDGTAEDAMYGDSLVVTEEYLCVCMPGYKDPNISDVTRGRILIYALTDIISYADKAGV